MLKGKMKVSCRVQPSNEQGLTCQLNKVSICWTCAGHCTWNYTRQLNKKQKTETSCAGSLRDRIMQVTHDKYTHWPLICLWVTPVTVRMLGESIMVVTHEISSCSIPGPNMAKRGPAVITMDFRKEVTVSYAGLDWCHRPRDAGQALR